MVFLSGLTIDIEVKDYKRKRSPGQYLNEYKYLLKTINHFYPHASAVLYIFQGEVDDKELKDIHPNTSIVNAQKLFKKDKGIDLNLLFALKEIMELYKQTVILMDTDCFIVNDFTDIINDYPDITAVTRGKLNWKGFPANIVNAVSIYNSMRPHSVFAYLERLIKNATKHINSTKDNWNNVQPYMTIMFEKAGVDLSIKASEIQSPKYGEAYYSSNLPVYLKAIDQRILAYPIQDEIFYKETKIIHYKNHKLRRKDLDQLYELWGPESFKRKLDEAN